MLNDMEIVSKEQRRKAQEEMWGGTGFKSSHFLDSSTPTTWVMSNNLEAWTEVSYSHLES